MNRITTVALILSVLFLGGTTSADTLRITDPNDVAGRLDIRAVEHGHGNGHRVVTHRISVERRFATRLLRRNGLIDLFFSGRPNGCISMRITIDATEDGLRARGRNEDPLGCGRFDDSGGSSTYRTLQATFSRPNRRSIVIEIRRRDLPGRGDYGWQAETWFRKRHTRCERPCRDVAPDDAGPRGVIAHKL